MQRTLVRALAAAPTRTQRAIGSLGPPVVVDGEQLDPAIRALLALRERAGLPSMEDLGVEGARRQTSEQGALSAGVPARVGDVADLTVDGAVGPLRGRHYAPGPEAVAVARGPLPLLLFFHGGGFVVGDLESHDATCRALAHDAGVHVVAVDYRLAPEHPHPAAHEDAWAAWTWAVAHAEGLGADPERIAIGGDSAGGQITAVLAQRARDEGGPAPAAQLLIYPAVDRSGTTHSLQAFSERLFLTGSMMAWFEGHGLPDPAQRTDPRASPALGRLEGVAPAVVLTAALDPLRDEGEAYARALADAGVPVWTRRAHGQIHGFANMLGIGREPRIALAAAAGALSAMLGRHVA